MSAVSRPKGMGPTVDPGDVGWDALGMGVHFTLGNGQPGALLGDYPLAERNKIMHSTDEFAGWGPGDYFGNLPGTGPSSSKALTAADFAAINANSMAANAAQRAQQPLLAANGMSLVTPRQAAAGILPSMGPGQLTGLAPGLAATASPAPGTAAAPLVASGRSPLHATMRAAGAPAGAAPAQSPAAQIATPTPSTVAPLSSAINRAADSLPTTTTQNPAMPTGPITASGTGDITGSSANYYNPAYGGVPQVPDPISSASQAITGNLSNLGDIYNLAGSINQFGAQQAKGQYEANLPGYDQMTSQASQDILANLQGQVPPDVINQLQQAAAERGVATGAPGSANAAAQYLKALGLTSLDQQTLGQQQLTSAIQRTPISPLFNVASTLVTPNDEQAARMAANLYAAAPSPQAAAEQAMQNALKAIQAGAGSGGRSVSLPGGGGGSPAAPFGSANLPTVAYGSPGQPSTGSANPYNAWQSWYNSLPGVSGATASGTSGTPGGGTAEDQQLQDWWDSMFGQGSYGQDLGAGAPVDEFGNLLGPVQGGTTPPATDWTDPNYDPFGTGMDTSNEWSFDPTYDPFYTG